MNRVKQIVPIFMASVILLFIGSNFIGIFTPFFVDFEAKNFHREKPKFVEFIDQSLLQAMTDEFAEKIEPGPKRDEYNKLRSILADYDLSPRIFLKSFFLSGNGSSPSTERITYQISRGSKYALLEITLSDHQGKDYITHINVLPIPDDIRKIRSAKFSDATTPHFVLWILSIVAMSGLIFAIYDLFKTKNPKKHVWLFFFMFGIFRISIFWNSGDIDYRIFSIGLEYFGFSQRDIQPWILDFRVPIGLIAYFARNWNPDFAGFLTGRPTKKNGA